MGFTCRGFKEALDYEDVVWDEDGFALWKNYQGRIEVPLVGYRYSWSVIRLPEKELLGCGGDNWQGNCRRDAVDTMFKDYIKSAGRTI
jgi:hypothetical protein